MAFKSAQNAPNGGNDPADVYTLYAEDWNALVAALENLLFLLFVSQSENRLGIGTVSPSAFVHLAGLYEDDSTGVISSLFSSVLIVPTGASIASVIGANIAPRLGDSPNPTNLIGVLAAPVMTSDFSGTVSVSTAFRANPVNILGGSLTTQWGFFISDLTGASNNRALGLGVSFASGAFNIYSYGSADNYINGMLGIGTLSPTHLLDVNDDAIRVRQSQTPASASASGQQGEIAWDSDYLYVCVAPNSWKRVALSSW